MPDLHIVALWVIGAAFIAFGGFLVWDGLFRWPAYRDAHNCTETGETQQRQGMYCHPIGKVIVCSPHTYTAHEWLCDGGERLWR